MAGRTYKIRKNAAGTKGRQVVYRLTVPPEIARNLPDDVEFSVELTEDGILYRPVVEPAEPELPSWAKR